MAVGGGGGRRPCLKLGIRGDLRANMVYIGVASCLFEPSIMLQIVAIRDGPQLMSAKKPYDVV